MKTFCTKNEKVDCFFLFSWTESRVCPLHDLQRWFRLRDTAFSISLCVCVCVMITVAGGELAWARPDSSPHPVVSPLGSCTQAEGIRETTLSAEA